MSDIVESQVVCMFVTCASRYLSLLKVLGHLRLVNCFSKVVAFEDVS